nr:proteoglycan 4 isoform X2 [Aedes albopictus]
MSFKRSCPGRGSNAIAMLIHQAYVCGLIGLLVASQLSHATTPCSNSEDCTNESLATSSSSSKSRRSASPILNDVGTRNKDFLLFENNKVDQDVPPSTKQRSGKDLLDDSFQFSKNMAMNLTGSSPNAPPFIVANNINGRQNANPDIQDIITGIVKLLNGNVNVHANTQPTRRHSATRINNRGPPRISEAQPVPNEFEGDLNTPPTSSRPPYSFERPQTPVRPFLTGVPIPEQIVPSMQQTNRPGFVSQNRPPWQRPKPRPPISPNRRPMPPYKPYPTNIDFVKPEIDHSPITVAPSESNSISETTEKLQTTEEPEAKPPATTTTESEVHEITTDPPAPEIKEEKPVKKADKPNAKPPMTEVQYTVEPAGADHPSDNNPTSSEPFHTEVPSVYEINSIEYLPATSEPTTSVSLEPSTSDTSTPTELITPTKTLSPATMISTSTGTTENTPTSTSTSSMAVNHKSEDPTSSSSIPTPSLPPPTPSTTTDYRFHPRPGLVLDDPDFKPGGKKPIIRTQNHYQPQPEIHQSTGVNLPNYGEIFDVTLSAIQGPAGSGSQQTIKINPYRPQNIQPDDDASIILTATGDEGFVSIDGKRSYIDLFGDSKTIAPTSTSEVVRPTLAPGVTGTGYAVAETEPPQPQAPAAVPQQPQPPPPPPPPSTQQSPPAHRPIHHRPKYPLPPVRIDTCIVGDDSTCDQAQNERCKTENGVSSCHCRPGYARRKHREPCRRIVSLMLSMRVDKIYERRIQWDNVLASRDSEKFQQLSYEAVRAMDSAMSMTPFSDEFMEARVNGIYTTNPAATGLRGVFVNYTISMDENAETLRPQLKSDIQRHLLGVIHRRNNNIGNSALYVDSPTGAVSSVQDVDECTSDELNDCDDEAKCTNMFGTFRCECGYGYRDPWADQPQRAGRECLSCPDSYCNNRGTCMYDNANNKQVCKCLGSYYGTQCEIDGEVLGVAVGASVAAVVIIVLTLICLIMWSRKWQREHKNAMGSPVFGYMGGGQVKTPVMGQAPYQVTLEDRMRWAQIADVMAQANHYATFPTLQAEPVAPPRPASAMYGYPNLQTIGNMNTLSMHGTLPPMHAGTLPPVPLPRSLGLNRNGMRTLENSSSSEEEDRADLLGRNFNVPRPKSRSNASVTSGIYYDVDYAPTGAEQLYGISSTLSAATAPVSVSKSQSNIPMSTYTSGSRPVQTSYYK